ncbi:cytochrome P450 [Rhizophagus diaphanus]|nr:cytochrome P450 [Rhizophagus diaphanus] [Rhizophagus sp. MUCL 43196]
MKLAANVLTTILYLLAVHKDVQKKVRDEILRVLGDNLMPSVNWEDPEKFIPERFENEKHDHYAWLSFGGGNRLFLGFNFSLIEQRITLCALWSNYYHEDVEIL